jgi:dihydrofolate reductase
VRGVADEHRAEGLIAVVAMTPSGVIGRDGDMPWHLASDLQRFKRLTLGGVLIMGRKTFDSIGRALPGRRTIVITRNSHWSAPAIQTVGSPQAAADLARRMIDQPPQDAAARPGRAFVVGGAEVYRQLLPQCHTLYLTRVWSQVHGDTKLSIDLSEFRVIEQTRVPASAGDDVPTEFVRFVRRDS